VRTLVLSVVALLAVGVVLGRDHLIRPAPIDERMPVAADEPVGAGAADRNPPSGGAATSGTGSEAAGAGSTGAGSTGTGSSDAAVSAGPVFVHVAGAVASPGVVELPAASRVVDAVAAAGGLRADADPDRVNLAAPLVDGSRIVLPVLGQEPPAESVTIPPPPTGGSGEQSGGAPGGATGGTSSSGRMDLNTASVEELDELPGVGPATAQAIVDHRSAEGRFGSVDELLDVRGIGEAKLEALRDLVTVG
jgi:competence protein ComEA